MRLHLRPNLDQPHHDHLRGHSTKQTKAQDASGSTQTEPDDLEVVPFSSFPPPRGAMDAAGPVDGANGRAAHEVLGNRYAIPTAPTAQTEDLQTDLYATEELQILCPPPGVAGFQTFLTGRIWTFGDTPTFTTSFRAGSGMRS
jgi:hypothetical protein